MIDSILDSLINIGRWVSKKMYRMHLFLLCFDILAGFALYSFVKVCFDAISGINISTQLIETPWLIAVLSLASFIWIFHIIFYVSLRNKENDYFKLLYFSPALLCLLISIIITKYIDVTAKERGYIMCNTHELASFQTTNFRALSQQDCVQSQEDK